MAERQDVVSLPAAEITQWLVVEVEGANHLVGVFLSEHPHLPPGHWIISSRIVEINAAETIAIAASTGRIYRLRERLSDALIEAHKLIDQAPQIWRTRTQRKSELARQAAERDTGESENAEVTGPDVPAADSAAPWRGGAP